MPTPPNDDTKMLFRLIADGRWHPYEEIRDKIAAAVPPGRALRKYQERVDYARKYKDDPDYDTSASEDERIYLGARACAQIAITSWKGRGVQYSGDGVNKQIRIKPGFTAWGLGFEGSTDPAPEDSEPSEPAQEAPDGPPEEEPVFDVPTVEMLCDCIPTDVSVLTEDEDEAIGQMVKRYIAEHLPPESPAVAEPPESAESREPATEGPALPAIAAPERSDMALFSESEIRHLIREEVEKALDQFQIGMEQYLNDKFDQLRLRSAPPMVVSGKFWFEPFEP